VLIKIAILFIHLVMSTVIGLLFSLIVGGFDESSPLIGAVGFVIGLLAYMIFVMIMLILMDRWADEDEDAYLGE
jgi:uncharacterized membrane protein YagU involved in acid resistance